MNHKSATYTSPKNEKKPHHKSEALFQQDLCFSLHLVGQPGHNPVFAEHRHAINQRSQQTDIKLDIEPGIAFLSGAN